MQRITKIEHSFIRNEIFMSPFYFQKKGNIKATQHCIQIRFSHFVRSISTQFICKTFKNITIPRPKGVM